MRLRLVDQPTGTWPAATAARCSASLS